MPAAVNIQRQCHLGCRCRLLKFPAAAAINTVVFAVVAAVAALLCIAAAAVVHLNC